MGVDFDKLKVDTDKHPYFCKLLSSKEFIDEILMPPAFVKGNKKMLSKTCLLKTDEGRLWEAKIEREKSKYFICEGEWPQFVLYHKMELGDILLFFLVDKSTFRVLPCTQKSCRNLRGEQLFEELSSSSEEESDGDEDEDEDEDEDGDEDGVEGEGEVEGEVEGEEEEQKEQAEEDEKEGELQIRASRKWKKAKAVKEKEDEEEEDEEEEVEREEENEDEEVGEGAELLTEASRKWKRAKVVKTNEEEQGEELKFMFRASRKRKRAKRLPALLSDYVDDIVDPSRDGELPGYSDSGGERKSHAKASRDPDEPKRPLSAYMAFKGEFMKKFKEENPNKKSVGVVGIAAVEKWKQLSDADKAPYVAEAQKRMDEYLQNLVAYSKLRTLAYVANVEDGSLSEESNKSVCQEVRLSKALTEVRR